jgi:hypothetical protein
VVTKDELEAEFLAGNRMTTILKVKSAYTAQRR